MKKITFSLFALIAGTTFAQNTDLATASTFAEIVEPLTITKVEGANLNFGRIIAQAEARTVSVDSTGSGTRTIDADMDAPGGVVSHAAFNITGSYTYKVTLAATPLSYQGTASTGEVTTSMGLTPKGSFTSNSGDKTLYVGGELEVGANQAPGNYESTVNVTVTYE